MKTLKNFGVLSMVLAVSLIFASCKKEYNVPVATTNVGPVDQTVGSILDIGTVDSTLHQMVVTLNDVSVSMYGQPMGATTESSKIELLLYTNSDAYIQDGTYNFSSSNDLVPFVIKSATVTMPNSDTNYTNSYVLSSGTMSLSRTRTSYAINIDGMLESGDSFQGSFTGELNYSDLLATSKKK